MSPLFDFECQSCGEIHEEITPAEIQEVACPECGNSARKIVSCSGVNCANEDAPWIRSVREVVDKEGGPHCQRFLKEPTRQNYKAWMKGEGLRPLERGERMKPPAVDLRKVQDHVLREYGRRHA